MARRYGEPIDVRSDLARGVPESFLWRGRVYLVREVLDHWWERHAWWAAAAARAVHGEGESSGGAEAAKAATRSALGSEREIWRVEACRGRQGAIGVFDLCHDHVVSALVPAVQLSAHASGPVPSAGASSGTDEQGVGLGDPGSWHLVRVGD
jgi:hypothetical protein